MYSVNPYDSVAEDRREFVLGGGPCQWGEYTDENNLDISVWPRSFAAGEVLWSYTGDFTVTQEVRERFNDLSCKMRQLGINSGPIFAGEPCVGADKQNPKYSK